MPISNTALMLNADGSIYHLFAKPGDIAPLVILVGDPNRAQLVAQHFDELECEHANREFVVKTGRIKQQRITVVGTGIGTGNIDIVMNELDALVNIDFQTREIKKTLQSLTIIRIGTAGTLQAEIKPGDAVISSFAFGLDGLLKFYQYNYNPEEITLANALQQQLAGIPIVTNLYIGQGNNELIQKFSSLGHIGLTFTCSGFYGPQHRKVREPLAGYDAFEITQNFSNKQHRILNFEMESAAIYSLGRLMNHRVCSISSIAANRITDEKTNTPIEDIEKLIENVLNILLGV